MQPTALCIYTYKFPLYIFYAYILYIYRYVRIATDCATDPIIIIIVFTFLIIWSPCMCYAREFIDDFHVYFSSDKYINLRVVIIIIILL